jgi:hypothetical protein
MVPSSIVSKSKDASESYVSVELADEDPDPDPVELLSLSEESPELP